MYKCVRVCLCMYICMGPYIEQSNIRRTLWMMCFMLWKYAVDLRSSSYLCAYNLKFSTERCG